MGAKSKNSMDVVIGRNVRIWRMAKGMTQAQVADRLGMTFQQLQKCEVGANRIGAGRLVKLSAILGVPIATLFHGTGAADKATSLLSLLDDSRSFRLAHAFAAIENSALRVSLVNLVEKVVAVVPQSKRTRT